jgi:peptide/nickel transport system permease protein
LTIEVPLGEVGAAGSQARRAAMMRALGRNPSVVIGAIIVAFMVLLGAFAPMLGTIDPAEIDPVFRNKRPGVERTIRAADGTETHYVYRFGTDTLGRDVYSRVVYGARVSLIIGVTVALLSASIGLVVGLIAGYVRWADGLIMRVMDGLMAIPSILLALALMALVRASVRNVIIALVIPEIPRTVRLIRASVLSLREQLMVEGARAVGAGTPRILLRYILPALVAPLIVQGTYICASAILVEAYLSFLGAGTPPHIPSWGNIMAEGRAYVQLAFWIILFPGMFLAATVLAINLVGDGLRDLFDVRQ